MSISILREKEPDGHGLEGITMRYENGGAVQVFKYKGREMRFGPMASDAEVAAAFKVEQKDEG